MTTHRPPKSRFHVEDEESPRSDAAPVVKAATNDLGLSHVDSTFAIGQSGGVVVVMQELHGESGVDSGDFAVSQSRFDKRKLAQQAKEDEARRKKEEERKAAIALKKEQEAKAAREAAAAQEAARKLAEAEEKKKRDEAARAQRELEKQKKQEKLDKEKEAARVKAQAAEKRVNVPAPPPPAAPAAPKVDSQPASDKTSGKGRNRRRDGDNKPAAVESAPQQTESVAKPAAPSSEGSKAILRDSAVVGIGSVISFKPAAPQAPVAPVVVAKTFASASVQTDAVRILPMETVHVAPAVTSSAATNTRTDSAAAWWLQQAAHQPPAPQAQQNPVPPSNDQFMMQAYIDAMQRMSSAAQAPQPSSYGYWTAPQPPSAADMYWQQQQNVYQSGAPGRYSGTAPRRL